MEIRVMARHPGRDTAVLQILAIMRHKKLLHHAVIVIQMKKKMNIPSLVTLWHMRYVPCTPKKREGISNRLYRKLLET
jgi:hypothetical protein